MTEILAHEFGTTDARRFVLVVTKQFADIMPGAQRSAFKKYWDDICEPVEGQEGEPRVPAKAVFDRFRLTGLPLEMLEMIWDVACQEKESSLSQYEFYLALRMISAAQSGIKPPITTAHLMNSSLKMPKFDKPPSSMSQDSSPPGDAGRGDGVPGELGPSTLTKLTTPAGRSGGGSASGGSGVLDRPPSRSSTKSRSKHKTKRRKHRRSAVNTNDSAVGGEGASGGGGLAEGETATSLSPSQPGATTLSRGESTDTRSEGGDSDRKPSRSTPTSPASAAPSSTTNSTSSTGRKVNWTLTEKRRADYEKKFPDADVDGDGIVSPLEARAYFKRSELPQKVLKKVWELSATHEDGKGLRMSEFIVATHLVVVKVKHSDAELPETGTPALDQIKEQASRAS